MPQNKPLIENFPAMQDGKRIQYYNIKIPQNIYAEKHYECITDAVFIKNNLQALSEIHSKIEFCVSKTEYGKDFSATFNIRSTNISGTNSEAMKLLDLNQLLAVPTKETVCLLNKNGGIKEILNTDKIYAKWQNLFTVLKQEIKDENLIRKILETGNMEFSNPLSGIKKTQLYNLFFLSLFNKQISCNQPVSINMQEASHLLNGQTSDFQLSEKKVEISHFNINLTLDGSISNCKELCLAAQKTFRDLLPQNTAYNGNMSIEYCINAEYGYPVFIKSKLKESLSDVLVYEQTLEVREK
jgi:hypothetical protein